MVHTALAPDLLRVEQAAQVLNVSRSIVYRLIQSGELQSIKVRGTRRIPRTAITAYIRRLTEQPYSKDEDEPA